MKLRFLLLPLTLAAALLAQIPAQFGPAALPGAQSRPGSLAGTVVNSITHAPIRNATVSMANSQGLSRIGTTDEAGKFQIANVEPGSYKVEYVHAQGYLPYQQPRPAASPSRSTVAEDQRVADIVLELLPLGVITGIVVDDEDEPLQGAQVTIMAYNYSNGSKSLRTVAGALADERGMYRLFNLEPGRYFVRAWLPPGKLQNPHGMPRVESLPSITHRSAPEMAYVPVFYPNASDVTQAKPSQVTAGGEVGGIDFRLRRVPAYHIRGKFEGAGQDSVFGAPCSGPDTAAAAAQYAAKIQAGGRFDLAGVPTGVYCLTLGANGPRGRVFASATVTVGDRNADDVTLASMAKFPVPGDVLFDGPASDLASITIGLESMPPGMGSQAVPSREGTFSVPGVAPGAYRVSVYELTPPVYLKAMRYGADDVSDGIINVTADEDTLTLVLGTDSGKLSGEVQTEDGDPASDRQVTVAPPDGLASRLDLFKTTRTDSTGQFQMMGLAPGEYTVYAWDDSDVPMAEDADFRQQFSSRATAVTIGPAGAVTVQVKVVPAEEIRKVKERF